MKLFLAALFACLALASAQMPGPRSDGRPGCRIRYEFDHRWRNNYYSDRYWECTRWGQPAEARWCPEGTRYLDTWQTCVPGHMWENTPYSYPPTSAYNPINDQCEEMYIPQPECPPVEPQGPPTPPPPPTEEPEYPEGTTDEPSVTEEAEIQTEMPEEVFRRY